MIFLATHFLIFSLVRSSANNLNDVNNARARNLNDKQDLDLA